MNYRIILILIFVSAYSTVVAQWIRRDTGISGGNISSVVASGSNTFAAIDGSGVYASSDNGLNWTAINTALNNLNVRKLHVQGATLFAATAQGVFRVPVAGPYVWESVSSGLTSTGMNAIAGNTTNLFATTFTGGVFTSVNNGNTWTAANSGLTNLATYALLTDGTTIFISTQDGIFRSLDNGASWSSSNTGMFTNEVPAAFVKSGTSIFATTSNHGVYVSNDNGSTWAATNTGLTDLNVWSIGSVGSNVFAGTFGSGVFVSANNGASWSPANTGMTSTVVNAIASLGTEIFLGTTTGIFHSADNGTTWASRNSGIKAFQVNALVVNGSTVFAATSGGAFRSFDSGVTWTSLNTGLTNTQVSSLAVSGSVLLAGTEAGIFRSTNNGTTWTAANTGLTDLRVLSLYVRGTKILAGTQTRIYLSEDSGVTWTMVTTSNATIRAFGAIGTTIFAATNTTLYKSTDEGVTWTTGPGLFSVGGFATNGATMFAGGSAGFLRSTDNGDTFVESNTGLPSSTIVNSIRNDGSTIFIATSRGVFLSVDNGFTWSNVGAGIAANVYASAVNFVDTDVIVGTSSAGIWIRPFSTFIPTITSFTPSSAVTGTTVTLTGTNFGSTPASNIVKFNGVTAVVSAATTTSITTTVPSTATSGNITVTVNGITATSANTFTVIVPPTITSFTPASGSVGTTVTISGASFSTTPSANTVKFNGVDAVVTAATATELTTTVPANATSGTISVTVNSLTATTTNSFTVLPVPVISSFTPTAGPAGTTVTITGTNFSAIAANNTVRFNGVSAVVASSTTTSIMTSVPATATSGLVTVTVDGVTGTSTTPFTIHLPPTITSFTPVQGATGTQVIITGTNFSTTPSSNTVTFNGTAAVVSASTSASITTTVPPGATSGPITVSVNSLTVTSSQMFTVFQQPTITSFAPLSARVGDQVTITGLNFSSVPANNVVSFNGTAANVSTASETTVTVTVPAAATTGPISVTVNGLTATSASNFVVLPPLDLTGPIVTNTTLPTIEQGGNLALRATIADAETSIQTANVSYRFISAGGSFTTVPLSQANAENYSATIIIPAEETIGVEFKFAASNSEGIFNDEMDAAYHCYISVTGSGLSIPYTSPGVDASNYRIVAVPLNLAANTVGDVFDELGVADNTKWRISHYSNDKNEDLDLSSQILPGRGYWLITRDAAGPFDTGEGVAVEASSEQPYQIELSAGWNQIGNPFAFNLRWADVQAFNDNLSGLRTFNGTFEDDASLLAMEGGFVYTAEARTINIPVLKDPSVNGGRISTHNRENALTEKNWEIMFELTQGNQFNKISGIGMHEQATPGLDMHDGMTMPRFFSSWLELNHESNAVAILSKDIVPTASEHTWNFTVESASEEEIILSWRNEYFGSSGPEIFLWDESAQQKIDMRTHDRYTFDGKDARRFRVVFGSNAYVNENTKPSFFVMHSPWPNPVAKREPMNVSFAIPDSGESNLVTLLVRDLTGREVYSQTEMLRSGNHKIEWSVPADLSSGLYVITLKSGRSHSSKIVVVK